MAGETKHNPTNILLDPPLTIEDVLVEEVEAVYGSDKAKEEQISKISGNEAEAAEKRRALYNKLYELDSAALCLSGGGIRSAAFALGVIQALATHTGTATSGDARPDCVAEKPAVSLLSQVHYLSTVSGGGYIGSWLSAWISRAGFAAVWRHLTRKDPPDLVESPSVSWLRSYSSYLTPKRGLMSADTWAAASLFLRNMYLNWLVIIPPLCALLIVVKGMALLIFAAHNAQAGAPVFLHRSQFPDHVGHFADLPLRVGGPHHWFEINTDEPAVSDR